MTKKPLLRKLKKIPSKETRQELSRAHTMIALLAISLIVVLCVGSRDDLSFEPFLSYSASILLVFVALFSLMIAVRFRK